MKKNVKTDHPKFRLNILNWSRTYVSDDTSDTSVVHVARSIDGEENILKNSGWELCSVE